MATSPETTVITIGELISARVCPAQHHWRHNVGLTDPAFVPPMRMTDAYREGLRIYYAAPKDGAARARDTVSLLYDNMPGPHDGDWMLAKYQTLCLLAGYCKHNPPVQITAKPADYVLTSSGGGAGELVTRIAADWEGTSDGDAGPGALLICLINEDLSPDSDYWTRARADQRACLAALAQFSWPEADKTLMVNWVVTRKPTIRVKKDETLEAYRDRLTRDIGERPEYYYAARAMTISEAELGVAVQDLHGQLDALQRGYMWRARSGAGCGGCEFSEPCHAGQLLPGNLKHLPARFVCKPKD